MVERVNKNLWKDFRVLAPEPENIKVVFPLVKQSVLSNSQVKQK